jgi:hypothetical protein
MAIMQRTALGQVVERRAWNVGVRFPSAFLARSVSAVGRLIVGSGGEYRNYPANASPTTSFTRSSPVGKTASTG